MPAKLSSATLNTRSGRLGSVIPWADTRSATEGFPGGAQWKY